MPESLECFTVLSKMPQTPRQCRPHLTFLMYQERRNSPSYKMPSFILKFVCNAHHNPDWVLSLVLTLWTGANPHLPWVCMCTERGGCGGHRQQFAVYSIWDAEAVFLAAPDSLLAGIWCWGVYCRKMCLEYQAASEIYCAAEPWLSAALWLSCVASALEREKMVPCVPGCCWHWRDSCCDLLRRPVAGNDSSSGSG